LGGREKPSPSPSPEEPPPLPLPEEKKTFSRLVLAGRNISLGKEFSRLVPAGAGRNI
jgi:hypothetical protein